MNKYIREIIALLSQLLVFYILPLFADPTDTMGVIILTIILTLIISVLYGFATIEKMKYAFSIIVALIFIPTIFIYFNETATIYIVWYLLVSTVGLIIGTIIRKTLDGLKK